MDGVRVALGSLAGIAISLAAVQAEAGQIWKGTYHHGVEGGIAYATDQPILVSTRYRPGKELVIHRIVTGRHRRGGIFDSRDQLKRLIGDGMRFRIVGKDLVYRVGRVRNPLKTLIWDRTPFSLGRDPWRSVPERRGLDGHSVIPFSALSERAGPFFAREREIVYLDGPGARVVVGRVEAGKKLTLDIPHRLGAVGEDDSALGRLRLSIQLVNGFEGRMHLEYKAPPQQGGRGGEPTLVYGDLLRVED